MSAESRKNQRTTYPETKVEDDAGEEAARAITGQQSITELPFLSPSEPAKAATAMKRRKMDGTLTQPP